MYRVALVASYYLNESIPPALFLEIIQLKEEYGFLYSAISTSLFGGLIPFIFMRLSGRDQVGNSLFSRCCFCCLLGIEGSGCGYFLPIAGVDFWQRS